MKKDKAIFNLGVARNKKPLQNIYYKVNIKKEIDLSALSESRIIEFETYKFKSLGYLSLSWCYEKDKNCGRPLSWHGFITPNDLKLKIGQTQWAKFCNGKREFIVQRRVNGNNIAKKM
jgi:hypothetical protein